MYDMDPTDQLSFFQIAGPPARQILAYPVP